MRFCEVCNISSKEKRVCFCKRFNKCLCQKHYFQLLKHGKIFDPTSAGCRDKNIFIEHEDYIEVFCRNRAGEQESFLIDKDDKNKVLSRIWSIRTKGSEQKSHYVVSGQSIYLHRFILNADNNVEIDHINGNALDNRKSNLRIATRSIQLINTRPRKNITGHRGVSLDKRTGLYKAEAQYCGKRYYTKCFKTLDEAVFARKCLEEIVFPDTVLREDCTQDYENISLELQNEIRNYIYNKFK